MGLNVAGRLKKGCIRVRPEMAQGMAVNLSKAPGRGGKVNDVKSPGSQSPSNRNQNLN